MLGCSTSSATATRQAPPRRMEPARNTHPGRHEASRPRAMLTRLGSIAAVAVLASRQHLAQACLGDGEQAGPAWRLDWLVEHNMLYF
jgi:hypothetical protein